MSFILARVERDSLFFLAGENWKRENAISLLRRTLHLQCYLNKSFKRESIKGWIHIAQKKAVCTHTQENKNQFSFIFPGTLRYCSAIQIFSTLSSTHLIFLLFGIQTSSISCMLLHQFCYYLVLLNLGLQATFNIYFTEVGFDRAAYTYGTTTTG